MATLYCLVQSCHKDVSGSGTPSADGHWRQRGKNSCMAAHRTVCSSYSLEYNPRKTVSHPVTHDLLCVEWDVPLYTLTHSQSKGTGCHTPKAALAKASSRWIGISLSLR